MWSGNALHMPTERRPRFVVFFEAGNNWRMVWHGQSMTWVKNKKTVIIGLARLGVVRLRGWGLRDSPRRSLETVGCITECRSR